MGALEKSKTHWSYTAIIIFTLLGLIIGPFLLFGKSLETYFTTLSNENTTEILYAVIGGGLLAGDPILPTPSSIIATYMGTKLGFVAGAIVNSLSLIIACFFGYYVGVGGRNALRFWGKDLPVQFSQWVKKYGLVAVLLCRPVPVLSEASLIIAGAASVKKTPLFLWTGFAQIVLGTTYAYAGAAGSSGETLGAALLIIGHIGIPVLASLIVLVIVLKTKHTSPLI